MEATAYGVLYWVLAPFVLAFALLLYYLLRRRAPLWLLIPLVIVLAPVGVLVVIIGTMFLLVVVLMLYSVLSGHESGTVGIKFSETYPLQVYVLEGAAALLIVAVIVYLIRRS